MMVPMPADADNQRVVNLVLFGLMRTVMPLREWLQWKGFTVWLDNKARVWLLPWAVWG